MLISYSFSPRFLDRSGENYSDSGTPNPSASQTSQRLTSYKSPTTLNRRCLRVTHRPIRFQDSGDLSLKNGPLA